MSLGTNRGRTTLRYVLVGVIAALTLASCNSALTPTRVIGLPSIGISVPLRNVACTTSGSCLALGTTGGSSSPSSVGEYRRTSGHWSALVVPLALSSVITTTSCWSTGCLIGGVQPSGSLLWAYNASSQSIATLRAPRGGLGLRAMSCFASSQCATIMTTGVTSAEAISFTNDGGVSWSAPTPLDWSIGDTTSELACTDPLNCMATSVNASDSLVVEVTHDGGSSWTERTTPSSWLALGSLDCSKLDCVGLAQSESTSLLVRTSTFGRTWRTKSLVAQANSLACTKIRRCVVGGETQRKSPWLATINGFSVNATSLKYVPSPIEDVACSTKVCVGIGVSTVLELRS